MDRPVVVTRTIVQTALLTVAVLSVAAMAAAQRIPDTEGRVFGLVGGSFGDGDTAIMTSAGAGLRLTRNLGVDFELLYVNDLNLEDDDFFILQRAALLSIFPPIDFMHEGSVTAFLTKFTADFPIARDRLIPFVTGGGGIGYLSERIGFGLRDRTFPARPGLGGSGPAILPFPYIDRAQTGLALTLGGGLDVRLWQGLAVGADIRWLRLLATHDTLDFAYVASRVSYRF